MQFDILDFERVMPKQLLDFYLDKLGSDADRRSFETMYQGLQEKDNLLPGKIFTNYQYAGRTAVNIFEEITLPSGFINRDSIKNILQKELGTSEFYNKEFQPSLTEKPQINYVDDRGASILIQFVSKGNDRRVRDGYEVRTISSINIELAIVHLGGPTLIELRCPYNMHSKYLSFFEDLFRTVDGFQKHRFEWIPITRVSNSEAEKIAQILSAGLIEADHKDDGIYDRNKVIANPKIRDLREHPEYVEQFKNKMLLSQVLIISYTEETSFGDYTTDIKFKINLNTGFQFLSKVSEAVIDYVMGVFIDVRYNGIS